MMGTVHVSIYISNDVNHDLPAGKLSEALDRGMDEFEKTWEIAPVPPGVRGNTTRAIQAGTMARMFSLCPEDLTFNEFAWAMLWTALGRKG